MTEPDMTTTRPLRHPSPRQLPPDAMPRPTLGTARSVRAWTAPLVLLLLAACGGGQDAGTGVTQGAAAAARSAPDATRHTLNAKAQALRASGLSSAEVARQLLDYAESVFKDYFPGHPATQSLPPFLYRAYANGVYLGVTSGGDLNYPDGVWLMGGPFGPAPQRVGAVTDFITPVAAGTSIVTGMLYAPVGTQVVLQSNGGDDLAVVVPPFPGGTDPYNSQAFRFTVPLPDSSHYQVTIKSQPAGMVCRVYQDGNGVLPIAAEAVKVGCEYDTDLVSRSTDNQSRGSYYDSSAPVIGGAAVPVGHTADGYGEGRFVAFVSSASGLGGATGSRQIFWRDRLTGDTVLVSAAAPGVEGNGDSFAPAISADGLTVVFESYASNLVAGDTNGLRDVFLWSALNREQGLQRVSVGAGGVPANAESYEPTVSGDGRVVAFSSGASNLSTGVSGINTINVYKRDLVSGTTTLVTRGINNLGVGGSRPMLSEDGSRLVFYSFASNLVLGDNNNLWDIFVHDQPVGASSGTLKRVSLTAGGGERNQGNESASRVVAPAISGDGRTVAFATTASNMVSGDTNGLQDVFTVDVASGAVQRASVTLGGVQGNADTPSTQGERPTLSYDGTWVAFSTSASNLGAPAGNVLARSMATGQLVALSKQNGSSVGAPMLSRNAAYVAFGAGTALDPRFTGSGLFVRYTGADRAWWWLN